MSEIPAIVIDGSEADKVALIENILRQDLALLVKIRLFPDFGSKPVSEVLSCLLSVKFFTGSKLLGILTKKQYCLAQYFDIILIILILL